ncbi:MAG: hypothetical protein S4CHLAM20_09390 [Chlamydiia bacterium]|nr:hypothetical protein [Chlamydiia bacterium]
MSSVANDTTVNHTPLPPPPVLVDPSSDYHYSVYDMVKSYEHHDTVLHVVYAFLYAVATILSAGIFFVVDMIVRNVNIIKMKEEDAPSRLKDPSSSGSSAIEPQYLTETVEVILDKSPLSKYDLSHLKDGERTVAIDKFSWLEEQEYKEYVKFQGKAEVVQAYNQFGAHVSGDFFMTADDPIDDAAMGVYLENIDAILKEYSTSVNDKAQFNTIKMNVKTSNEGGVFYSLFNKMIDLLNKEVEDSDSVRDNDKKTCADGVNRAFYYLLYSFNSQLSN